MSHMTSRDLDSPGQMVEMVYVTDPQGSVMVLKVWMGLEVGCVKSVWGTSEHSSSNTGHI